jgi:hypothetical protein
MMYIRYITGPDVFQRFVDLVETDDLDLGDNSFIVMLVCATSRAINTPGYRQIRALISARYPEYCEHLCLRD